MSSFQVDITALTKDLTKDMKRFQKEAIPKAEGMALNKVMTAVKGRATKSISAATHIKQKLIRARIGIFKRRGQKKVSILTHPLPIVLLKPKGRLPKKVSRASFAGRKFGHAFAATMDSGHTGVFERKGTSRRRKPPKYSGLPIKEVTIPIKHQAEPILRKVADRVTRERFPKEFDRAMSRIISRYVKGGRARR